MAKELPINETTESLSTLGVLKLIDYQGKRNSRIDVALLLLCHQTQVATFIEDRFKGGVENFASKLTEGLEGFRQVLPEDYKLLLSTNFDFIGPPVKRIEVLTFQSDIISRKMYDRVKNRYQRKVQENPTLNDFTAFINDTREGYRFFGEGIKPAGCFNFSLFTDEVNGEDTDCLLSIGIVLNTRDDRSWSWSDKDRRVALPSPLRWQEGCRLGISDVILKSQEKIIEAISLEDQRLGLMLTTLPVQNGRKMVKRLGYQGTTQLLLDHRIGAMRLGSAFKRSEIYKIGVESGWYGKIVHC